MPVILFAAQGKRIDPPVSVPKEPKHSPDAKATAEPLEEEPAQSLES